MNGWWKKGYTSGRGLCSSADTVAAITTDFLVNQNTRGEKTNHSRRKRSSGVFGVPQEEGPRGRHVDGPQVRLAVLADRRQEVVVPAEREAEDAAIHPPPSGLPSLPLASVAQNQPRVLRVRVYQKNKQTRLNTGGLLWDPTGRTGKLEKVLMGLWGGEPGGGPTAAHPKS